MRKVVLTAAAAGVAASLLFGAQALTAGHEKSRIKADTLNGYQEAAGAGAAGLSSAGTGTFKADIDDDAQEITYELTYTNLSAPATQAHIHFGNRSTSGAVIV